VVIQVCLVCLTIALVWLISILIPAIIQIKRTAREIEVVAKSIYSLSEVSRESVTQVNKTIQILSDRFKEDAEKIDSVLNKIKGVTEIIAAAINTPLIKIMSVIAGISGGLRFFHAKK
jgi:predicted PurR-regulated permease PerM